MLQKGAYIKEYLPGLSDGPNETALKEQIRARTMREFQEAKERMDKAHKELRLSKDEIKKGWATGKQLEQALASIARTEQKAENLSSYASDLQNIKAISKTTSDADGKFRIMAPPDAVFFAFASRSVNDETENYCWLVSATEEPFMLTNRNTVGTLTPENFAAHH